MLSDHFTQAKHPPAGRLGGTSASVFLYVDDVDSVVQRLSTRAPR
jgi:hypothetical protein